MTATRKTAGLSGAARADLLAGERLKRHAARADAPEAAEPAPPAAAFDFSELPEIRQLAVQRAAGDMLGIGDPFFRSHDAMAADTSVIDGRTVVNFSSYDYCGLNGHGAVVAAAREAIDRFGTSVSASRVVSGERPVHRALETAIADFLGTEDAVAMVSGHATNVTVIGHLLRPKDLVVTDAFIHNSVVEGARLSGAQRITFPHNDLAALDALLSATRGSYERCLIAVEGLYSMDGDFPDLAELVAIKRRHDAWLLVDEAHALGVLGATGRGIAEEQGVDPRAVEIFMGTLSKTLCGCGGYVAASAALVNYLKATAPGFVFSVGMPAPTAAASLACLEILKREPERVARITGNGTRFVERARAAGLDVGTSAGRAVVPVITGDSVVAAVASNILLEKGFNVLPIIFPAVPEKAARLRFFITSRHRPEEIDAAVDATAEAVAQARGAGGDLNTLARRILAR